MISENRNYSGKFIVIYGANNLGKSVQTRLLTNRLLEEKHDTLIVKYPVYNLEPTGPKINKILRDPKYKDRNIKELDLQKIYIQNRLDFQPVIENLLSSGIYVIAEDYLGTGIAWGVTNTITKEDTPENDKLKLIKEFAALQKDLIIPDISILLDGNRFKSGIEKQHRNEDRKDYVWDLNRKIYQILAEKFRWKTVKANQSIDKVHKDVWSVVNVQLAKSAINGKN